MPRQWKSACAVSRRDDPGEIQCERAYRAAPANAAAIADNRIQPLPAVGGITDIGEYGSTPVLGKPMIIFDGCSGKDASPDYGAALLHTQALEGVTSDRLDAASPEQVFLRYAEARGSERITQLSPQKQDMPVPYRIPELVPRIGTHKILIGQDLLAATPDSQFGHAAIPWKKGIIHGTVAQIPIQRQSLIDLVHPPSGLRSSRCQFIASRVSVLPEI